MAEEKKQPEPTKDQNSAQDSKPTPPVSRIVKGTRPIGKGAFRGTDKSKKDS